MPQIQIRKINESLAVIDLCGEVAIGTCPELRETISDLIGAGYYHLVINLAEVIYLDTTGLSTLLGGLKQVKAYRGALSLVSPTSGVQQVLDMTHLNKLLPIYPGENEALAYSSAQQSLARRLKLK